MLWTFLSIIIFTIAYKKKSLSLSGAIGGYLLGIVIFGSGGWNWIIPLIFFFISSSILSHFNRKEKSQRNLLQILSNGGLATIFAIENIFIKSSFSLIFYLSAIAAATADTWGTEVGFHSKSKPKLIFSKQLVPKGTSGSITLLGTIGSIIGAILIAVLGQMIFSHKNIFFPIVIAGISGSIFDSFLGRFFQAKYLCKECSEHSEDNNHCDLPALRISGLKIIDNNMVNFLNTLFGGIMGYFLWTIVSQ